MPYESGLLIVNEMQNQLSGFARAIVLAKMDHRVSVTEWAALAGKAFTLITLIGSLIEDSSDQERDEVLYVLEHGDIVLPEGT